MIIPKKARRVFQGVIFDVYHWQQKMYDGSYSTFERLRRPDTVQVIATQNKKVFICEEQQPGRVKHYGLFGGRVAEPERPLAAAKRELLEETGCTSDDWELYSEYESFAKIEWRIHYYIARNCKKTRMPQLDGGERITMKKVTFDQFIKITISQSFHGGEFTADMLRLQIDKRKREAFRNRLFH